MGIDTALALCRDNLGDRKSLNDWQIKKGNLGIERVRRRRRYGKEQFLWSMYVCLMVIMPVWLCLESQHMDGKYQKLRACTVEAGGETVWRWHTTLSGRYTCNAADDGDNNNNIVVAQPISQSRGDRGSWRQRAQEDTAVPATDISLSSATVTGRGDHT